MTARTVDGGESRGDAARGPDQLQDTRQTEEAAPWRAMSHHPLYEEINQSLVAALDIHDGDAIVDLGCGDGAISQILIDQHGDRLRIWAIDPDEDMLADARALVGAKVGTCVATAEDFGSLFPPGSCDIVILANALHLVPDREAVYRTVRRVLAPKGVFAFNTTFYWSEELRASTAYAMQVGFEARSLARKRGVTVPRLTQQNPKGQLAKMVPPVDDLKAELRAAAFDVTHVEERSWMLDSAFMFSFMSAPYETAILLPDLPGTQATDLIKEACDKVATSKPDPVPRPWLTVVARPAYGQPAHEE